MLIFFIVTTFHAFSEKNDKDNSLKMNDFKIATHFADETFDLRNFEQKFWPKFT